MRFKHGWVGTPEWQVLARLIGTAAVLAVASAGPALARAPFTCGGAALAGGAQLLCSHTDPDAPTQVCSFSWSLMSVVNHASVVTGSFLLPRGVANSVVYQGSGYAYALSNPIVLCQGRKDGD